jgi:hypothetical protein
MERGYLRISKDIKGYLRISKQKLWTCFKIYARETGSGVELSGSLAVLCMW